MIPQANPKAGFDAAAPEFLEAARRVLASGWYILGEEVASFERNFAAWCNVAHGIGCANGTDAIELALRALGAGPGKVVFTVAHTAVATVAAVERAGALPWLVDVDAERLTMCPVALERAIRACRERAGVEAFAVLPVHIYGQPADMDALLPVARSQGLFVAEDCAQSHGALYKGRMTGSMGQVAAFSLYPTKNLGAFGDAGIVLTDDAELAERMNCLRQYGWKERYISAVSGINSRMDPVQAAFLNIKLGRLEQDNAARRRIAALYDELLTPLARAGVIRICTPAPDVLHAYHQYVIRTPRREALQAWCGTRGVGTAVHYPAPVHLQPAYLDRQRFPVSAADGEGLPHTEQAAAEVLSLPLYPQLGDDDVRRVAQTVLDWAAAS